MMHNRVRTCHGGIDGGRLAESSVISARPSMSASSFPLGDHFDCFASEDKGLLGSIWHCYTATSAHSQ